MSGAILVRAYARSPDVDAFVVALAAAMAVRGVSGHCDMLAVAEGLEAAALVEVDRGRAEGDVLAAMRLANDLRMRRPGREAWEETLLRVSRSGLQANVARAYLAGVDPALRGPGDERGLVTDHGRSLTRPSSDLARRRRAPSPGP